MNGQRWIALGALAGGLAVVLGAFGAHALEARLDVEQLAWWHTSVQYHGAHALALVLFGLFAARSRGPAWVGALFVAGLLLFSGSLYAMALGAPRWFGAITPIGGAAFIAAWFGFALAAWRSRPASE